jgi:threonine aldolase
MIVDFRSDTLTLPSQAMKQAMMNAPLGDDVFEEDPTINKLEEVAAQMFGMEAALFCPSGTMTNQIAIKAHTRPGDEVICDKTAHIYLYEGGGIASNSQCSVRLLDGKFGQFSAVQVEEAINVDNVHFPKTSLVAIENTANKGGGSIWDFSEIENIRKVCDQHGLMLHLDGARLFNALIESKQSPKDFGQVFHSISICLSKGLGAPVGSLLLGTNDFIKRARRIRKAFGGGMRQAGILAAAGLFALENNIERLSIDHKKAKDLETILNAQEWVEQVFPVETNIIVFELNKDIKAQDFLDQMNAKGIRLSGFGGQLIRFVTHMDITDEMMQYTAQVIEEYVAN